MDLPNRKSMRMENYNYSSGGWFFVTICVKNRATLLRNIDPKSVGVNNFPPLSKYGEVADEKIRKISEIYSDVKVDKYCIMPDHIHLIICIKPGENATDLSRVIKQFKGAVTKELNESIWQKLFHDHIIRNINDYNEVCKYIYDNPLHWELDFMTM